MTAIDRKYDQLGGYRSVLGSPIIEEKVCPDGLGHFRHYEYGVIYWHPDFGAFEVHGEILAKWADFGWEQSFLGYPITDECIPPDQLGRFNHFQGGSIYWHPNTGTFEVHGSIREKWADLGWEKGVLGYPLSNETPSSDGEGRYSHFQGGSIYWYPVIGAFEIHGAIRRKWARLGWEQGFIGYPITDETTAPDGVGCFNHFEHGSIYYHPGTGAHEVHGSIRAMWSWNNWEKRIGYPKTDEIPMNPYDSGRYNAFQKGTICWTPDQGAWFDFTGSGEGRFSCTLTLYEFLDYQGKNHIYRLNSNKPLIFNQDLALYGLDNQVASLRLRGLCETCSIYLYQGLWSNKYIKVTGLHNGGLLDLADAGKEMNDRIASVAAVNHGTASILITANQIEMMTDVQFKEFTIPGIQLKKLPEVSMVPASRTFRLRIEGVVEATQPDSNIKIDIYFRPHVAGKRLAKVYLARWRAQSGGSFFGLANGTVLEEIETFFRQHSDTLASCMNSFLAGRLSRLEEIPDVADEAVNVRRVNVLPEGVEIVLSDTASGASFLKATDIHGLSTKRPAGEITNGLI